MNTHGVGIHPDEVALQPLGARAYLSPLRKGRRAFGSARGGIRLQSRVVAPPVSLATVSLGTRAGGRTLPNLTNLDVPDGARG